MPRRRESTASHQCTAMTSSKPKRKCTPDLQGRKRDCRLPTHMTYLMVESAREVGLDHQRGAGAHDRQDCGDDPKDGRVGDTMLARVRCCGKSP